MCNNSPAKTLTLPTWLFTLLFLIMLVLKLDKTAPCSWFLGSIPIWIFDTILAILIVEMAGWCKSGSDPKHGSHNIKKHTAGTALQCYLDAPSALLALNWKGLLPRICPMASFLCGPCWLGLQQSSAIMSFLWRLTSKGITLLYCWSTSCHWRVLNLCKLEETRILGKLPNSVFYCFRKIVLVSHGLPGNPKLH